MSTQLATGDTTLLAETHAISSGLKTYVSSRVVEGVETVRRAMGGHGFLASTGIGRIYANELPSTTYEGDNLCVLGARSWPTLLARTDQSNVLAAVSSICRSRGRP